MDAAPALGPATAPVTIVEYADFGCPACWEWHKLGILDQLRAKYGDQIRFVWRDFPGDHFALAQGCRSRSMRARAG